MFFVSHEHKTIVFWFHKCGHTSLIKFFSHLPSFEMYEAWGSVDSYSYIEETTPELLDYAKCMVVRNPLHYSYSGYKHFSTNQKHNIEWKYYFDNILLDRYGDRNYTFDRHLEILISNDILMYKKSVDLSKEFHVHCCKHQHYTYRPDVKIIKLEESFQLIEFLNSQQVFPVIPMPHLNQRDKTNELNVTPKTIRLWKLLYEKESGILGYDIEKTIHELSNQ